MSTTATSSNCVTRQGLPLSWYFDPEILEAERRALFADHPDFVGHTSLVPRSGDYHTLPSRDHAETLLRDGDQFRLVGNVCRHRQSIMLSGRGECGKSIVCPLHCWAYDLSGRLIGAPHLRPTPRVSLPTTSLQQWNGLLFAGRQCVLDDLEELYDWPGLAGRDYVFAREERFEQRINWKTILEIFMDNYHVGIFHEGLKKFLAHDVITAGEQTRYGQRYVMQSVGTQRDLTRASSEKFQHYQREILRVADGGPVPPGAVWLFYYPNLMVEWYPHVMVATTVHPVAPEHTLSYSQYYLDPRVADDEAFIAAANAAIDEVDNEDIEIVERVHRGRAALYRQGRDLPQPEYFQTPMEDGICRFQDYLRSAVERSLDS